MIGGMTEQGGIIMRLLSLWNKWGRSPNTRLAGVGAALFVVPSAMLVFFIGGLGLMQWLSVKPPAWFERAAAISFFAIIVAQGIGMVAAILVILFAIWRAGIESRRQRLKVKPSSSAPAQPADSN